MGNYMINENTAADSNSDPAKQSQSVSKPKKILPTWRVGFDKQLGILRAFAAASGPEHKAVSNDEVGSIVAMHKNTVSICNPFFVDIGLFVKEGQKHKPTEDAFNYAAAHDWSAETATLKLAPLMRKTWFAVTLIPKLAFRTLSKDEAIGFLADEAKAPKEYKPELEFLLEYLRVSGIVISDGASVSIGPLARDGTGINTGQPPPPTPQAPQTGTVSPAPPVVDDSKTDKFSIPIPGKDSVTITFPKDIDREDWEMAKGFIEAYVSRLKKWNTKNVVGDTKGEGQ